ncbi:MAG: MBL fold metallo-hydrolase, partial [Acidobacteria bacterium]|nr:MBL fold metallo-hydrolase [Acidobacteriota bacterium]
MNITWLGHSAIKIEGSKIVYIDPFLTGNPNASMAAEQIQKADIVIVTHDHGDHLGDAFPICKRTGATLVAMHEIAVDA